MLIGRVVGEVWATVKDEKLEGARFMIVQQVDPQYRPQSAFVVAVDSLNAGPGDIVLVAQGSSARQTKATQSRPVDAVIMAVVDRVDVWPADALDRDYEQRRRRIDDLLAQQPES
ncbi:MAG: EutN/CcmL family microcompartment protein [Planctomycetes bacterium]|nr:EutN/CcmL family microcompartment protein [Planctomycetota bacterium]